MQEQRFDQLTRRLSAATSRRQALKLLAGAVIGGLFAGRASGAEALFCRGVGEACNNHRECCTNLCRDGTCGCINPCRPGFERASPTSCECVCPAPKERCFGACVDVQTDPRNCGSCFHFCRSGFGCHNGHCCVANGQVCPNNSDAACCSGFCLDGTCCVPASGSCSTTADCCTGICTKGTCCFPPGGDCTQASDCCTGICDSTGHCVAATTTPAPTTTTHAPTTTTTAAPTTTTTATPTTTTTPVCIPSGTPETGCNQFNQRNCCSGQCAGFQLQACGQTVSFEGCCDAVGSPCTGPSGLNVACCFGFCAMSPGQTTGVCQSSPLGAGQACGANIDCLSCNCSGGVCQ